MSDWYLARQLHNFQQGIRGTHPQDFSGAQMVLMSKILADDRAINDLLAYIIRWTAGPPAAPCPKPHGIGEQREHSKGE